MFGCLRKLGCLALILAAVAVWYIYTHGRSHTARKTTTAAAVWEPLTPNSAEAGRRSVESLSQRTGPVFANLTAAQAASYIFLVAAKQLPPSARHIETALIDDQLRVRAEVPLKDMGGPAALGPLASIIGDRDTVQLAGTIHVIKPGLGEFVVEGMKIGQASIPSVLIPRVVQHFRRSTVEGVSDRGLPMKMPEYISDVRIENGKITLYKSVQ